ncbi:MAG: intradiol ring-cleavage dioxygenase [Janthinobacterium lividum]
MSVKQPLSRRTFVRGALASAAILELQQTAQALGFGAAAPVCKLVAEQEVGPFYLAQELLRSDIREGKPGVPLALHVAVLDARTCQPLPHAAVDVWHCDAMGAYSGFTAQSNGFGGPGGPGGPPHDFHGAPGDFGPEHAGMPPAHPFGPPPGSPPPSPHPTDAFTFLRGIQITDGGGAVMFQTIFPGFYQGRTNHIHFKVRLAGHVDARRGSHLPGKTYEAGHTSHTGQIFFPEQMTAALMQQGPYAKHRIHRVTPAEDGIFRDQNGSLYVAEVSSTEGGDRSHGLTAKLIVAVDPTAVPQPVQRGPDHDDHP